MHAIKRRNITLIEFMIAMLLLALVAAVVAYNYRGSVDGGRALETTLNINRIRNVLDLELARKNVINYDDLQITSKWQAIIRNSPLIKDPDEVLHDGWGGDILLKYNPVDHSFILYSENPYCKDHPTQCPGPPK